MPDAILIISGGNVRCTRGVRVFVTCVDCAVVVHGDTSGIVECAYVFNLAGDKVPAESFGLTFRTIADIAHTPFVVAGCAGQLMIGWCGYSCNRCFDGRLE